MEFETIINIVYEDSTMNIYTSYPTLTRRMRKKGYEPNRIFYMDGKEDGWEWDFPLNEVGKFLKSGYFKVGSKARDTVEVNEDEIEDEEEAEE